MIVETITAIKLFSDVIQSVSGNVSKLRGTPRQRFGKSLAALLGILNEAQEALTRLIEALDKFQQGNAGPKQKSRSPADNSLMAVWDASARFENACYMFIRWVETNERFSNALDLLSPESREILKQTVVEDARFTVGLRATSLHAELMHKFQELQRKPTKTTLTQVKRDLEGMDKQIEAMKQELRKLAADHLTIEDLF